MSLRRVPGRRERVLVIGAGLSGLAAALHLLGDGRRVTVVEAADHVGGRCATERIAAPGAPALRFDTGASVLTMPDLVDRALAAAGLTAAEVDPAFAWAPVAPAYLARYADGREIAVPGADPAGLAGAARAFAAAGGGDGAAAAAGVADLAGLLRRMHGAAFDSFMARSYDSPLDMVAGPAARRDLLRLARLGGFGSLDRLARRRVGDADLARLFSFQALYAGVAPDAARAVYGVIAHMDTGLGVHYPLSSAAGSGAGAVPELMAAAVRRAGGEIRTSAPVTALVRDAAGEVVAAEIGGAEPHRIACDAAVATVDRPIVEGWLGLRPRRGLRWSPSAVVAHGAVPVALTRDWPAAHHLISFGRRWAATFAEICAPRGGRLMGDPSLLVTRPAVTAPDRVVDGHEPVSVLAPAPNLDSAPLDWGPLAGRYVAELAGVLEDRGLTGLRGGWRVGRVDTPATWAAAGMGAGSPFGLAHLFRQTGPFRPRNLHPAWPANLVAAGSTTVPGVGVPTVLISGALAAGRLGCGGPR